MCGSEHPDCGCPAEDKLAAVVAELPFKSAKQEKFLFANHPEIAKRWQSEHGNAPSFSGAAITRRLKKQNGSTSISSAGHSK